MTELPPGMELALQATAIYQRGNILYAIDLLDLAIGATDDERQRMFMELQKVGWLRETGAPEAAERLCDRLEERLAASPPEASSAEQAHLSMERGILARQRGELETAESLLSAAERLVGTLPEDDQELILPTVLANRASVLLDLGQLTEARELVMRSLETDRRLGDDRGETHDLNLLGQISQQLGNLEAADQYYRESLDVARAGGLTNYAAQAAANREALTLAQPSGEAAGNQLGLDYACTVSTQGVSALQRGHYDEAARLLRQAAELHVQVGNAAHSVHDRLNLSAVEISRGNPGEAVAVAQSALAEVRERSLTRMQWFAEYRFAEVIMEAIGMNYAAAQPLALDALQSLRDSVESIDRLRLGIDHPEDRQWLFTNKEAVYRLALITHMHLDATQSFLITERARSRAFLESLGARRVDRIEQQSVAALRRRELTGQALRTDLNPDERTRIFAELSRLRAEITRDSPRLAPLTGDALPDVEQICAAVPDDARLVSFFLLDRTTMAVFVLSRQGVQMAYLTKLGRPVDEIVGELRTEIESDADVPAAGAALFKQLFIPLIDKLGGIANLFVVPHGILNHVPWPALWFPTGSTDPAVPERLFLRNRFLIAQLPSASYLPLLTRTAEPFHPTGVVIGDPGEELLGAAEEATTVASLLGVRPFLGGEATRQILLSVDRPTVLHVCCHGRFDTTDPLLSGLELADGLLSVEDFLERGPAAKLTVFSACLTGLTAPRAGDELVGLARAALSNGGRAVIATLWSISDESSSVFFQFFYDALRQGATVRRALFHAQTEAPEEHSEFGNPFDWAPFALFGDPNVRLYEPDPDATS